MTETNRRVTWTEHCSPTQLKVIYEWLLTVTIIFALLDEMQKEKIDSVCILTRAETGYLDKNVKKIRREK